MSARKTFVRFMAVIVAAFLVSAIGMAILAQDDGDGEPPTTDEVAEVVEDEAVPLTADEVQSNIDIIWVLLAGFLVFFMQAGFAMLEGGMIRQTGVVNSMAENFMDACITGIFFFLVGYGIAFGSGNGVIPSPEFMLGGINGTEAGDGVAFVNFFFQFAFAGAAATIATGAMAERTNFIGKLIYSAIIATIIYPIVVYWTWGGGWLAEQGFLDFAGSGIVHMTGGVIAIIGALFVGSRPGRVFGEPPKPHNLALATLGTFVLWFGWYGFNVGSTLAASDQEQLGLVAVNTTLAACAGALTAMFVAYILSRKWDLGFILNGSLAGLVGITAGCAFVSPVGSIGIGLVAGIVVYAAVKIVERIGIDDAVGAFAVHGACGAWGVLAIGIIGIPALTDTAGGLLYGGGLDLFIIQLIGVVAIIAWTGITAAVMFGVLRAVKLLRMPEHADEHGIDAHEHGADAYVLTAFTVKELPQ